MDEGQETQNPALDAARDEAKDIATNTENPRHQGYLRGDKTVSDYIDGLYQKSVPSGEGKLEINEEGISTLDVVQGNQDGREQTITELKTAWGGDYEQNFQLAQQTARDLFPTGQEERFERVAAAVSEVIGEAEAIKLLHAIGIKRKG